MVALRHWFRQLLISVDQTLNVLLGVGSPDVWADETFSSRCWRNRAANPFKWMRPAIDFVLGSGHCRRSFDNERLRLQSPPEERGANT